MSKLLSICIPTFNRPEWLIEAINSISADIDTLQEIEICVSNNCSESDYSDVVKLIDSVSNFIKISYVRHSARISLDENHHFVKRMASGNYIYFLGDDDFFLENQISKLVRFIKINKPDLAIFNGLVVDSEGATIGKYCDLQPKEYKSVSEAYFDLRFISSFGPVLVRKDFLQDADFMSLYDTYHAYACFWLSIFRRYDQGENVKIIVPDFPCVALRSAQKNYNYIDVMYKRVPKYINIMKLNVPLGLSKKLIDEFESAYLIRIYSYRFLLALGDVGCDLNMIADSNCSHMNKYRIRIHICKYLTIFKFYSFAKSIYRLVFPVQNYSLSDKVQGMEER